MVICVCVCLYNALRVHRQKRITSFDTSIQLALFTSKVFKWICLHNLIQTLLIKANEMHCFSALFGKELYMFRTDLLSIIRSLNTVFTVMGICHTSYVACLLARSWPR